VCYSGSTTRHGNQEEAIYPDNPGTRASDFEVEKILQVQPELWTGLKVMSRSKSGVSGDSTACPRCLYRISGGP
jgi:hypothetical protein